MLSRLNPVLVAGIVLDIAGLLLAAFSLPEGGVQLGAGALCFVAGTLIILYGARGGEQQPPPDAKTAARARRGWQPERELAGEPPRKVKLAPAAAVSLMAWAIAVAFVGFFTWQRIGQLNPPSRGQMMLGEEGLTAEATIHRRETRETPDGEPRYYLYYNFRDLEGSAIRASVGVTPSLFERYQEGDTLEVHYVPGQTSAHYAPALEYSTFTLRSVLIAAVVAFFFLFLLEARRRRHRKLVMQGKAVAGVIEKVQSRGSANAVTVRFETMHTEQTLRSVIRRRSLGVGDAVTVLYDPSDPREAELYVSCLYRAV